MQPAECVARELTNALDDGSAPKNTPSSFSFSLASPPSHHQLIWTLPPTPPNAPAFGNREAETCCKRQKVSRKEKKHHPQILLLHSFTAYLRLGNAAAFLAALTVLAPAWAAVRRRRMARVFLERRSRGTCFLPA